MKIVYKIRYFSAVLRAALYGMGGEFFVLLALVPGAAFLLKHFFGGLWHWVGFSSWTLAAAWFVYLFVAQHRYAQGELGRFLMVQRQARPGLTNEQLLDNTEVNEAWLASIAPQFNMGVPMPLANGGFDMNNNPLGKTVHSPYLSNYSTLNDDTNRFIPVQDAYSGPIGLDDTNR